ncbi:hypothetical protein OAK87_01360 [bacterium]|nr:hypothetical protein [bacterium]
MSREVQFNPDTGSGEFVGGSAAKHEQQASAQEMADVNQARAFRNTTEHLSQRAAEKKGSGSSQVGSGGVELEMKLQETQRELYQLNNGALPHNPLRMLELQALQERLASELVGVDAPSFEQEVEEVPDIQKDLEENLANDPAVKETLQWSSTTFSNEVNETFNAFLDSSKDAVTTQSMVQELKTLRSNPDAFSTAEPSAMNAVSQQTLQWFSTEYSPKIAQDVHTISEAVRNGVTSKADAMKLVMKSGELRNAFLTAAHNPEVDFTLGL